MPQKNNPSVVKGLNYPFGVDWAPDYGAPFRIAEGVFWFRMPLPGRLNHINLWLLEDGDGWTIVDTGMATEEGKDIWRQLFEGFLANRPVNRVIVTHMHPDHIGLAGWLCEQFNCALWTTREEFLMCKTLVQDTGKAAPPPALDFYIAAGYTDEQVSTYKERFGTFGEQIHQLPDSFRRIKDRETITINGMYWQVITGHGHSPEHAALYCPALKILISGDQVLPRITPFVSIYPSEPESDPLSEWVDSCARIQNLLPDDVLVLPAHKEPFYGLRVRLAQIMESHRKGLARLYELLAEPKRAVDCFEALFNSEITEETVHMATGETLAHLNCLLNRKMISSTRVEGIIYYQQLPDVNMYELLASQSQS